MQDMPFGKSPYQVAHHDGTAGTEKPNLQVLWLPVSYLLSLKWRSAYYCRHIYMESQMAQT